MNIMKVLANRQPNDRGTVDIRYGVYIGEHLIGDFYSEELVKAFLQSESCLVLVNHYLNNVIKKSNDISSQLKRK